MNKNIGNFGVNQPNLDENGNFSVDFILEANDMPGLYYIKYTSFEDLAGNRKTESYGKNYLDSPGWIDEVPNSLYLGEVVTLPSGSDFNAPVLTNLSVTLGNTEDGGVAIQISGNLQDPSGIENAYFYFKNADDPTGANVNLWWGGSNNTIIVSKEDNGDFILQKELTAGNLNGTYYLYL